MEIFLSSENAVLYSRLHVSGLDLGFAGYCLEVLLKKGWHHIVARRMSDLDESYFQPKF